MASEPTCWGTLTGAQHRECGDRPVRGCCCPVCEVHRKRGRPEYTPAPKRTPTMLPLVQGGYSMEGEGA